MHGISPSASDALTITVMQQSLLPPYVIGGFDLRESFNPSLLGLEQWSFHIFCFINKLQQMSFQLLDCQIWLCMFLTAVTAMTHGAICTQFALNVVQMLDPIASVPKCVQRATSLAKPSQGITPPAFLSEMGQWDVNMEYVQNYLVVETSIGFKKKGIFLLEIWIIDILKLNIKKVVPPGIWVIFPRTGKISKNHHIFLKPHCDQTVWLFQVFSTVLKRFCPVESKNTFVLVLAIFFIFEASL